MKNSPDFTAQMPPAPPAQGRGKAFLQILLILMLFLMAEVMAGICATIQLNLSNFANGGEIDPMLCLAHPKVYVLWMLIWDLILLLLLWVTKVVRRNCLTAGCHSEPPLSPSYVVSLLTAFLLLVLGNSALAVVLELPDDGVSEIFMGVKDEAFAWLTLCLVGPLVEELIFREGIARQLRSLGMRTFWAALLSAAVFGVAHGNLAQAIPAIILGTALGLYYFRTNDLRLCLTAHVLNNTLAFILLFFPELETTLAGVSAPILGSIGAVLILAGAAWTFVLTKNILKQ
ncbi:MAG: CPBP family intramembrane metalloprotease [Bacteroidales bacterium]|nr:CPBP family intramembrane metalloprotease [Bacteroidales bacterium]MDY2705874.1 CPBP family intramembrane glutamic endopeptidase [Alloprevotella sp.]